MQVREPSGVEAPLASPTGQDSRPHEGDHGATAACHLDWDSVGSAFLPLAISDGRLGRLQAIRAAVSLA